MKWVGVFVALALFVTLSSGYSTSGNKILDNNGNPILLRGIARPSLEWNANGESLSLSDYQKMKGWGANVVRIGLSQCFWLSGNVGYASGYVSTVAQQVTWITSLGMGVILDLHWSNQGKSGNGCGQQNMPDAISTTFWKDVATKYKGNPSVMFELYNEPHDVSWSVWKNGGDAGGYTTPGFQSLYNTVRATGATNLIIVSGLNYAFDLSGVKSNPISGNNIVYNTHPYDFAGKQENDWEGAFGYLSPTYPLIATEFGEFNCNPSFISKFVNYANTKKISWTAWGWYPQGCGFPSLINDWAGNPSAAGQVVKTSLTNDPKTPGGTASTTKSATSSTTKAATSSTTGGSTTGGGGSNTITIYKDAVVSPFADWSWADSRSASDTSQKNTGTASYGFVPSAYKAVYFYASGSIDTSKHSSITFYVRGSGNGGQNINVCLLRYSAPNSIITGPDNSVQSYIGNKAIPNNGWAKGTINLSNFPSGKYDGIWFQDKSGGTQTKVFIDDVVAVGK